MPRRAQPASSTDPVTAYAEDVVSGRQVAGPDVREACARHLRDLETGGSRGLTFDRESMQRAIDFFAEVLRLNGGEFEGVPFLLSPWQAFIIGSLFGWLREDGTRRFRTAFIEVGKGNGKSPLAAGIGLYCLVADGEARAEVYAAATKKDQAMILFRDAVAMVNWSPDLKSRILQSGKGERVWNLAYERSGSWFRPIASDYGQSGPRPHCSLVDEVHEHPDGAVLDMLKLGHKGRRQPLTVEITNSGFDRTTVCFDHHEYSQRVVRARPGEKDFDDEWFGYVCGLDKGDDPFEDEGCWIKANPNLGVSIKRDYLATSVREAIGMPAKASKVQRLNFCMWVGAEQPWISEHLWIACERPVPEGQLPGERMLKLLRECDEVVGGLDLSGGKDLTALALAGKRDGRVIGHVEFWTPEETVDERKAEDKVPFDDWVRRHFLHATRGRGIDYAAVVQRIVELQMELPLFRRIAFDPYRIRYLTTILDDESVEVELVPHPQGGARVAERTDDDGDPLPALWMPRSLELIEGLVNNATLEVEQNPVLTWNSASAVIESDAKNNRFFTKRKSRGRIDGLVALTMSVGLLLEGAPPEREREYQIMFA